MSPRTYYLALATMLMVEMRPSGTIYCIISGVAVVILAQVAYHDGKTQAAK